MTQSDLEAREDALRGKYREVWTAYKLGCQIEYFSYGDWYTTRIGGRELNLHVLFNEGPLAESVRFDKSRHERVLGFLESGANKYRIKV